jgi:hypothetical protein
MKKYKISESKLNEFWGLFTKKPKTPYEIQKLVDNDPVLRKLQKDYDKLGLQATDIVLDVKKRDPSLFNDLVKIGLVPKNL